MRIALVSDCYLPRLGGIEVQVHDLARGLAARGHDVHVLTATPADDDTPATHPDGQDDAPWTVHRLTSRVLGDTPVSPFAGPRLRELMVDADVVHVHCGVVSPFAHLAVPIALDLGRPTLLTFHSMLGPAEPVLRLQGRFRRWARAGAQFSAVSDAAAEPLRRAAGGADVAILPNGIDPSGWRPPLATVEDVRGPEEPVRIVTAMRLAARKRPFALLRALRRVREAVPSSRAIAVEILGAGPLERPMRAYLARHGMTDWVSLPGRVERTALAARYHDADVYVSPARLESFGIAPLEARTAGLPVVAMRVSGSRDYVVDGVNGLLADDDAEFATALTRLVLDDDLRARIRSTNASSPPDETWDTVIDLTQRAYRRVSGQFAPTPTVGVVGLLGDDDSGDGSTTTVHRGRLSHGRHPVDDLAAAGFDAVGLPEPSEPTGRDQHIDLVYRVRRRPDGPTHLPAAVPEPRDVARAGERALHTSRLGAYAVVTAEVEGRPCVLLTTMSGSTSSPGRWLLPGGGLDLGESVGEGVAREVFEETGQRIPSEDFTLEHVRAEHWTGRNPQGVLEDYHPVLLVFRATVADPQPVVVHDVGGSTGEAWWQPVEDLPEHSDRLIPYVREAFSRAGLDGG